MNEFSKMTAQSVKEFENKKQNAIAHPCTYFISDNGLAYLIKGTESIKITCAIHVSVDQRQDREGIFNTSFVELNSTTNLDAVFDFSNDLNIVEYGNYIIGVYKTDKRIETSGVFHYFGEIIENRNKQFIVTDESEAEELYLSNSMLYWLAFGKDIKVPLYPSYISPMNTEGVYLSVDIRETKALNIVKQINDTDKEQYLEDKVLITLINATLNEAQDIAQALFTQVSQYGYFGVQDLPKWNQVQDTKQVSFGIKSNIREMELNINYWLLSGAAAPLKYIEQFFADIKTA